MRLDAFGKRMERLEVTLLPPRDAGDRVKWIVIEDLDGNEIERLPVWRTSDDERDTDPAH